MIQVMLRYCVTVVVVVLDQISHEDDVYVHEPIHIFLHETYLILATVNV